MEITIYTKRYDNADNINNFMDLYYSLQMKHFASDLLKKGLSPKQISDAVAMAIKIASSSSMIIRKHFMPVYSAIDQEIIKDCKLSRLGYGLVLMNANPNLSMVGDFQVNVLNEFFNLKI